MTLITKPDFTYVWASGGAVVAPNDTKKQLGWVAEAPPFQYDNWLQNRQDQMLAHINQRGIPAWDGLTNYEAGGLSYVQGSDGKVYKSVAASGPSSVVSNPTTDGTDTYWTIAFADVGAFLTQAAGDTRYTQRSNNLSDLTNVAAARTNLGAAPLASPAFTGTPTAPTASPGTSTTQVATTAFVQAEFEDSGWVSPSFINSFYDAGNTRYRLKNGVVTIAINTGRSVTPPNDTTIFSLPVGYRPTISCSVPIGVSNSSPLLISFGALEILTDGQVRLRFSSGIAPGQGVWGGSGVVSFPI